jgi:hypothetical protein
MKRIIATPLPQPESDLLKSDNVQLVDRQSADLAGQSADARRFVSGEDCAHATFSRQKGLSREVLSRSHSGAITMDR